MKASWRTVGEIVAVISVVLSLIFVGVEINQNTSVAQNQAYNDFTYRVQELGMQIATDEVLPGLVSRIGEGETRNDFSSEDRIRLGQLFTSAIRAWEGLFRAVQSGLLPASVLVGVGDGMILNNSYFREAWPNMRNQYTEEFVTFFEMQPWNE